MKGILVLSIFGLLAVSSLAQEDAAAAGEQCAVDPPLDVRKDCGIAGETQETCQAKGCCWSPLPEGIFGPWCFQFITEGDVAATGTAGPDVDKPTGATGADDDVAVTGGGTEAAVAPEGGEQSTQAGAAEPTEAQGTTNPASDHELEQLTTSPSNIVVITNGPSTKGAVTEAAQQDTPTEAPPKPTKPRDGNVLRLSTNLMNNPPFLLEKKDAPENATGKEKYEGMVPSLMQALVDEIGTDFEIQIVKDGKYGTPNGDDWTGMVGEVFRNESEMGGPLRVTVDREQAVDFTYPIIRYEAMMVMRKRHWNQEPKIESLEDLLSQDEVKYGILNGGDIERHILSSDDRQMVDLRKGLKPATNKDSNKDGIQRARDSSEYVFIVDGIVTKMLELKKPCDLQIIPAGFYHRQYAFAVPNLAPLRDRINNALVEIQHRGEFAKIQNQWYGEDECASSALALHASVLVGLLSLVIMKILH